MKKTIVLILALIPLLLVSCTHEQEQPLKKNLAPEGIVLAYNSYNLEVYLKPMWYTREVYNETVLFVGEEDAAPLMYKPAIILAVTDYGLETVYEEGIDYIIENNTIKRLHGSSIPFFTVEEYYRTSPSPSGINIPVNKEKVSLDLTGDRYLLHGEGDTFTSRQIAVSYTHNEEYKGIIPADFSQNFQAFNQKLKQKEDVSIVFYGDSITRGSNSSGTSSGGNVKPYADSWTVMVSKYIESKYQVEVKYTNKAIGGYRAAQGAESFSSSVLNTREDLLVLGFGMNDRSTLVDSYKSSILQMVNAFLEKNEGSAVLLVSTMLPNYESTSAWYGNQEHFLSALTEIADADDLVAVADMTTMHKQLFELGKRYRDATGNNINHPNDFLARLYAQVVLKALIGGDYCDEVYG